MNPTIVKLMGAMNIPVNASTSPIPIPNMDESISMLLGLDFQNIPFDLIL